MAKSLEKQLKKPSLDSKNTRKGRKAARMREAKALGISYEEYMAKYHQKKGTS